MVYCQTIEDDHIRNMTKKTVRALASWALARWINLLLALVTPVARRPRALLAVTLVDFCIGVSKLDGNVALKLVLEAHSLHTRDSLHNGTLSVSDVSDGADVDGRLPSDNFWRKR
jgi:hypothetical protein